MKRRKRNKLLHQALHEKSTIGTHACARKLLSPVYDRPILGNRLDCIASPLGTSILSTPSQSVCRLALRISRWVPGPLFCFFRFRTRPCSNLSRIVVRLPWDGKMQPGSPEGRICHSCRLLYMGFCHPPQCRIRITQYLEAQVLWTLFSVRDHFRSLPSHALYQDTHSLRPNQFHQLQLPAHI